MNQGELRDLVKMYIDDPHGSRYTSSQYTLLLNEAIKQVWRDFISNKVFTDVSSANLTFTVDTQVIALPTVYKNIQDVRYKDTDTSIPIHTEEKAKLSELPCVFIRRTGTTYYLGWYKEATATVEVTYIYVESVGQLIEGDDNSYITCIEPDYHDLIVFKAAALALSSDQDKFSIWDGRYREEFEKSLQVLTHSSDSVVDVMNDAYN